MRLSQGLLVFPNYFLFSSALPHQCRGHAGPFTRAGGCYLAMKRFTFSINRSHWARRSPSFAIGPASVNWMYFRKDESNLGHTGNPAPLGSPVFAKLVQYCCIASEICRSTALVGRSSMRGGPLIPRSTVPKT